MSFKAITNFYGDYTKNTVPKGENALESGHLISFSYDGESNWIKARVQSSMKSCNCTVSVSIVKISMTDKIIILKAFRDSKFFFLGGFKI